MKNLLLPVLFLLILSSNAWAKSVYVRTDGGTNAQCVGTTDAAYTSGSAQPCAFNHPNWAFPPRNESSTGAAVAGDTVVIEGSGQHGTGSYRVGCQGGSNCQDSTKNVTSLSGCTSADSYDCWMNTVPNNVTVIGCSATGCGCTTTLSSGSWTTTCSTPRPEIWGAGRIPSVFNVVGATGITMQDLDITDHATASYHHPTLGAACADGASSPSYLSAKIGILQTNSDTMYYKNLNVHGFCIDGFAGGSVGNHTYDAVKIFGNGAAGIDYDNCNNDGSCGVTSGKYMRYINGTTVSFNGCAENASSVGTIANNSCFDSNDGGYGDGVGGTNSAGTWTITDSDFSHNMSDGFDMLYMNRAGKSGGTMTVKRSRFEGNIGDQLKTDANVNVEDSYIIDNCGYFYGKSIDYNSSNITYCRGRGAIAVAYNANTGGTIVPKFYNNTITSNGDELFLTSGACTSGTQFISENNNLLGGTDFIEGDQSSIFFSDQSSGTCSNVFTEDYNTCSNNFKNASPCPASHSKNNIASSSTYAGTISQGNGAAFGSGFYTWDNYINELTLKSTSTAIGAAITSLTGTDSLGFGSQDRGVVWDMGALDYAAGTSPVCGNGATESGETCDDSNAVSGDGCSSVCAIESGWSCSGTPSSCHTTCGDGITAGTEQCDGGSSCDGSCHTIASSTGTKASISGTYIISGSYKITPN